MRRDGSEDGLERERVVCHVETITSADLETVANLARLKMSVRELGYEFEVEGVTSALNDLIDFCGLTSIILGRSPLVLERQPEQGEQALGVEEETHPGDLPL